jgi:hypothetical protein
MRATCNPSKHMARTCVRTYSQRLILHKVKRLSGWHPFQWVRKISLADRRLLPVKSISIWNPRFCRHLLLSHSGIAVPALIPAGTGATRAALPQFNPELRSERYCCFLEQLLEWLAGFSIYTVIRQPERPGSLN